MNQDVHLSFNPSAVLDAFKRGRRSLTFALIVALLGYTGYQISHAINAQPDQAYLRSAQQKEKVPNLRGNRAVLQQLEQLQPSGDTSIPISPGKHNPFAL